MAVSHGRIYDSFSIGAGGTALKGKVFGSKGYGARPRIDSWPSTGEEMSESVCGGRANSISRIFPAKDVGVSADASTMRARPINM